MALIMRRGLVEVGVACPGGCGLVEGVGFEVSDTKVRPVVCVCLFLCLLIQM